MMEWAFLLLILGLWLPPFIISGVHYAKHSRDATEIKVFVWVAGIFPIMFYHYLAHSRHSKWVKITLMSCFMPAMTLSVIAAVHSASS